MNCKFELIESLSQPVLSIKTTTSVNNLPKELGKGYAAIIDYLTSIGEEPLDTAFCAYYNMDMENLQIEMGFPVSKPLPGKGEIASGEIPAGRQVFCIYKGPYEEAEPVYNSMLQWVNKNNYSPTGICYEFYYNSPVDVPTKELITKIVFPIK